MRNPRSRIPVTLHQATWVGVEIVRGYLDAPPVAVVSMVESIVGGWWLRSAPYPVGRLFGTILVPAHA